MSVVESTLTRAAASSTASGSRSSLPQIAATVGRTGSNRKAGSAALARSANRDTASFSPSVWTGYSCSPLRRIRSRLVMMTFSCAVAASSRPTSGAASSTCSKLSRRSSIDLPARWRARSSPGALLSFTPTVCAIVGRINWGSVIAASQTTNTPFLNRSTDAAAMRKASRVFPVPPAPVRVTRRTSSRSISSARSATSC